jgi:hypothetical protein
MFHRSVSEKQEYRNNNIRISGSKVKQGFKGSVIECSKDEGYRKHIIAAKRELQEIKESIDAARDRLNKMVIQDERIQLTTKEIIEVSRQLDILIQDYNRKSVEIQEITEINNYSSD